MPTITMTAERLTISGIVGLKDLPSSESGVIWGYFEALDCVRRRRVTTILTGIISRVPD